jgi:hypothetical protein
VDDVGEGQTAQNSGTYQANLRAIGRYLDEAGTAYAVVLDMAAGMRVRYGTEEQLEGGALTFSRGEIRDLNQTYASDRGRGPSKAPIIAGVAPASGLREDVYRAVGHALDAAGASNLFLMEVPEGLVYAYDASDGSRRTVNLSDTEIHAFLAEARNRREIA